jgi:hypothetical protein
LARSARVAFDPGLEAQAEQAVRHPGDLQRSGRTSEAQPMTLASVAERFLFKITRTGDVEHDAAATSLPAAIPQNVQNRISGVWSSFETAAGKLTAKGGFDAVRAEIRDYLTGRGPYSKPAVDKLQEHLKSVVLDSMQEDDVKKDSEGKKKVTYKLNEGRFKIALERLVLGATGIQVEIQFKSTPAKDSPLEVDSILADYVFLPVIHGASPLWLKAIEGRVTTAEKGEMIPRLRAYLEGKGVSLGVWDTTPGTYRLGATVVADMKVMEANSQVGSLDPAALTTMPSPTEYTDPSGAASTGGLGHIGLRLGIYKQKGTGGEQQGKGRESHHMTQFLLLKYFSNMFDSADERAFPLASTSLYPGTAFSGGQATAFRGPGSEHIKLSEYFTERGQEMPCILLSREAHRMPGLHITPTADDLAENANVQVLVVRRAFRAALDEGNGWTGLSMDFNNPVRMAQVKATKGERVLKQHIYDAMQSTFHEVWHNRMKRSLRDALLGPERAYYDGLAQAKNPGAPQKMPDGILAAVHARAVTYHDTVMAKGGWM